MAALHPAAFSYGCRIGAAAFPHCRTTPAPHMWPTGLDFANHDPASPARWTVFGTSDRPRKAVRSTPARLPAATWPGCNTIFMLQVLSGALGAYGRAEEWGAQIGIAQLHAAGTAAATVHQWALPSPCRRVHPAPSQAPKEVSLICPRKAVPKPGQEVTISYGAKGNEELLFLYGAAAVASPLCRLLHGRPTWAAYMGGLHGLPSRLPA